MLEGDSTQHPEQNEQPVILDGEVIPNEIYPKRYRSKEESHAAWSRPLQEMAPSEIEALREGFLSKEPVDVLEAVITAPLTEEGIYVERTRPEEPGSHSQWEPTPHS